MFNKLLHYFSQLTVAIVFALIQISESGAAELDCMVKPEMYIELSSPTAGVLEQVLVNKGDHVTKGQPLVQLEASVEIAKVNQAKYEAANNSDINNRKVQLAFAKRTQVRYQGLIQKSSISQLEKDKADTQVTLAEIELKKARENKRVAALALELAKAQLALKTIKSPIDGIVIDRFAMVGESIADRAIMKLAQVDPLRVELVAPTEYFGLIKEGMAVDIRPERPVNKTFKATVTIVDQLIDPASGSFSVRMALPNSGNELVGGVNCVAVFNFEAPSSTSSNSSVLRSLIPRSDPNKPNPGDISTH